MKTKKDLQISYQWITNEELAKQPELVRTMSVKPPRTNNKIRLVKIGKIENKGKMNRRVNLLIND